MMEDMKLGYCGLYCGGCSIFQGTQSGLPLMDENNSPMFCTGCNSGTTTKWCTICNIKECNRAKGFRYCLECKDNPCGILTAFMNDPKYPYHFEVQENMKLLKSVGLSKWTEMNEKKYHCNQCDHLNNWFEKSCSKCGNEEINKIG
jgi:hypothetical protein